MFAPPVNEYLLILVSYSTAVVPQWSHLLPGTSPHQSWTKTCWCRGLCQRVQFPSNPYATTTSWTSAAGYSMDADGCDVFLLDFALTSPAFFQKQEPTRNITDTLSYKLKNVDIYRVRMRAQLNTNCHDRPHWSEWSKWSDDTGRCHLF